MTDTQLRLLLMTAKVVRRVFRRLIESSMVGWIEGDVVMKNLDEAIDEVAEAKEM